MPRSALTPLSALLCSISGTLPPNLMPLVKKAATELATVKVGKLKLDQVACLVPCSYITPLVVATKSKARTVENATIIGRIALTITLCWSEMLGTGTPLFTVLEEDSLRAPASLNVAIKTI